MASLCWLQAGVAARKKKKKKTRPPTIPLPHPSTHSTPQVFKAALTLESEADVAPLETLISEATKALDKAVSKGVLRKNTAARRKSRLAAAKRNALIKKGMYTPA